MQKETRKKVIEIALIFFAFSYIIGIQKAVGWGLTFEILTGFSLKGHLALIGVGMPRTFMLMTITILIRIFLADVKEQRDSNKRG